MAVPAFAAVYRPDLSDEITEFHYWAKNRYPEFLYKAYYFFYWSNGNPAFIQIASNSKVVSNGSIVQAYLYNSRGGSGQSLFNSRVTLSLFNENPILTIVESGTYDKTFVLDAGYFVEDLSTAYLSNTYSVSSNHDWIISVLGPPADKTALTSLVNSLQSSENIGYTPISWTAFQNALQSAILLLDSSDATQEQIDIACNELQLSFDSLILLPDTSTLESYLRSAKQIENDGFTSSSWLVLQSSISGAEALLSRSEFTENEVSEAIVSLQSAINGLRYPPSSSGLSSLIERASQYKADDYTIESWSNFQAAFSHAKALLASGNYTAEQLLQAENSLNKATSSLTWKALETPSTPDGHRYLIDGVLPGDLSIAQDAIMQNIDFGRNAGFWVFVPLLVLMVSLRVIRSIFGFQGESGYIDSNSPSEGGGFHSDSSGSTFGKSRSKKEK